MTFFSLDAFAKPTRWKPFILGFLLSYVLFKIIVVVIAYATALLSLGLLVFSGKNPTAVVVLLMLYGAPFLLLNAAAFYICKKHPDVQKGVGWGFSLIIVLLFQLSTVSYVLSGEERARQESKRAQELHDATICEQLSEKTDDQAFQKAHCFEGVAEVTGESVLCQKISGGVTLQGRRHIASIKSDCLRYAARSSKSSTSSSSSIRSTGVRFNP